MSLVAPQRSPYPILSFIIYMMYHWFLAMVIWPSYCQKCCCLSLLSSSFVFYWGFVVLFVDLLVYPCMLSSAATARAFVDFVKWEQKYFTHWRLLEIIGWFNSWEILSFFILGLFLSWICLESPYFTVMFRCMWLW